MAIIIVDYGAGNIRNVMKAIEYTGLNVKVSQDPAEIAAADGLVVPGVGAFASAMDKLRERNLVEPIKQFSNSGKPLLGVCLGMQLLFDSSTEFGETRGLGLISGQVVELPKQENYKVPQMGWNQNKVSQINQITRTMNDKYTYFVHSYYAVTDSKYIAATVNYGKVDVPSVVVNKNVIGAQFHPEKSGQDGLEIWQNFKEMVENV
ncbi:MAG: imidazole glycerol phosphate synthase subunit HisH [Leuconostoc mesenteroides]|uniref:Imidazole glycerol phosphate synthase subunit HisH n=1 Tax=Leuconostoc mesenteroides subsp. cremoris ATCC 19254 TaxID=586220 RepID=C2KK27_LEUMC|nr:imidazole glycerol phosphate synthase subunit HisH [Leuconostoc mesenteroides]EQC53475.1 imidazole glycerol phosphate synthase [Leuconostoc mesenteroides subsp. cremoris TIFN8]KDA51671.1 Imidazole glycerol phosphate synthase amidotransferase subunit [Leuconostoc mesenteroides subsp. cremoris T26]EEJ42408.1 imidazole glycerol phosphate synthase, glutamine amidotransferase subunit [Leuconostoc mesenteroides subsp. cremoris ATCC 19254]MCT3043769.1 imidazole glycerol phosphate synthase subunit H